MAPSPNGHAGRSGNGRFAVGNAGGPGSPHAAQVGKLRSSLLDAITPDDIREIATKLVALAKGGDLNAMRLLLDRCTGKKFVDQIESPPTLEDYKAWLLRRFAHLRDNDANSLSVEERRSRIVEICRTALARSEAGGQTEQLEHDGADDRGEVAPA